MKTFVSIFLLSILSFGAYSQDLSDSSRYSLITLDGKDAYIDIETGSIIYPDGNHYSNQTTTTTTKTTITPKADLSIHKASYIVKKGDTLYSIAEKYGVTTSRLASINNISTATKLIVGQRLIIEPKSIPVTKSTTTTTHISSNNKFYTVKKGDTLYSIAKSHGTTATQLARNNNIPIKSTLKIGQRLKVGTISQPTVVTSTVNQPFVVAQDEYRVQKGDTLYSIARDKGITVYELKKLNNLTANTLTIGQTLRIR